MQWQVKVVRLGEGMIGVWDCIPLFFLYPGKTVIISSIFRKLNEWSYAQE